MDGRDNDSEASLLSKTMSTLQNGSLAGSDRRGGDVLFPKGSAEGLMDPSLHVENDVIDDFVRGQAADDELGRRRTSTGGNGLLFGRRRGGILAPFCNMGVLAVVFAIAVGTVGFALRYSETRTTINRYLIACGLYGLATAVANFAAIHLLLKTMFLSKNERIIQTSVRDIVMNLVFSRDAIEAELATQARRAITTASVHRVVRQVVAGGPAHALVQAKLATLYRSPEGLLLAMVGVSEQQLRDALVPAVVQVLGEIAPLVEAELTIDRFISAEHLHDMLLTTVSARVEAMSAADLHSIVSGVLLPQLSFIVLWGCLVGMILGIVSEAAQLSKFIGETPS